MKLSLAQGVSASASALLTSTATLVCCVLPAVLVTFGAGASLAGLVSAFPQLVWMSEHKGWVFGTAGIVLLGSAALLWNARRLPCPIDPVAARACTRLRRASVTLFATAVIFYLCGLTFAFVLPWFNS
jgi:hypothetical protein